MVKETTHEELEAKNDEYCELAAAPITIIYSPPGSFVLSDKLKNLITDTWIDDGMFPYKKLEELIS